jgi:hypothetical protein
MTSRIGVIGTGPRLRLEPGSREAFSIPLPEERRSIRND